MTWAVSADPERFEEAIEWFESRFPVTEELLEQLGEFAGPRAWTIANVAELDIILHVWEALRDAIEQGTTLAEFKERVSEQLKETWGKADSHRIETIFRTNVQTAYSRGRWKQISDPAVTAVRPYLMFDAILDNRTTPICNETHRTVLPHDHVFWETHQPPLHFNCRSSLRTLTTAQAKKRGITTTPPDDEVPTGFGRIDEEWQPDQSKYPDKLWATYERRVAERP